MRDLAFCTICGFNRPVRRFLVIFQSGFFTREVRDYILISTRLSFELMNPFSGGGRIEVIAGSMFSGKTRELIERVKRAELAGNEIKVFKPDIDDRYEEKHVSSHNGEKVEAEVIDTENGRLEDAFSGVEADVVAIDEANFFSDKLVEQCHRLANGGARVILSGTDQDFRGEPFEPLPELMAVAERVDKLKAVCTKCGQPATRNQRLINGEPAHVEDPTIMVGADEKYEARCRHCHEVKKD